MVSKFTDEILDFMRKDYVGVTNREMALRLEREFGVEFKPKSVGEYRRKIGCTSGNDGKFHKGQTPHNKGVKGVYPGSEKGGFKKGYMPSTTLPVGAEVFGKEGYWKIKIANPSVWEYKHRLVWKEAHGDIPPDHVVIFKDSDINNCELDNLMCISKAESAIMCRLGLRSKNKEITEVGHSLAKLMMATSNRQKALEGE